jgi:acetyl esterase/lipase
MVRLADLYEIYIFNCPSPKASFTLGRKFVSHQFFATKSAPPSLLIYGGRDNIVQAKYGRQMHERLQAVGGKVAYLEIPWADHAFDTAFNGISNQLALYYTERFLAWALLST